MEGLTHKATWIAHRAANSDVSYLHAVVCAVITVRLN